MNRRWSWLAQQIGPQSLPVGFKTPHWQGNWASPARRQAASRRWCAQVSDWRRREGGQNRAQVLWLGEELLLLHPQWGGVITPGEGAGLAALWHWGMGREWLGCHTPPPGWSAPVVEEKETRDEWTGEAAEPGHWLFPQPGPLWAASDLWLASASPLPPMPGELAAGLYQGQVVRQGFDPLTYTAEESLLSPHTVLLPFDWTGEGGALRKTFAFGQQHQSLRVTLTARPGFDGWLISRWPLAFAPGAASGGEGQLKLRLAHRDRLLPPRGQGRVAHAQGWVWADPHRCLSLVVDVEPACWLVAHPAYSVQGRGVGAAPVYQGVCVNACWRALAGRVSRLSFTVTVVGR